MSSAISAPGKLLPAQTHRNITIIKEEDAHDAFISYASSRCCYRSSPARDGLITSLEPFNTYKYRLETFVETRSPPKWTHEPYTGQPVDVCYQRVPRLWNIKVPAPAFFKDQTQNFKVRYTSSVKTCHGCKGKGHIICRYCSGCGLQLYWLQGNVLIERCGWCSGNGYCQCEKCQGKKKLLFFIKLQIKWTTDRKELLVEQTSGLKSENLWKVSGRTIFSDSQSKLSPLVGFPDPSINRASERLIREHQSKYLQTSRVLQQRHTIELIPVTKVTYAWKEKPYSYIVYGNENRVYTDNYPTKCCCSVM